MLILVNKRYIVEQRLGSGSFGVVHLGKEVNTGKRVAIKLEHRGSKKKILEHEKNIYQYIYQPKSCVPQIYWYGLEGEYQVMVMEPLGPNLSKLFDSCEKTFTLKTILMIGFQCIDRLKHMHRCGIIHRDIKPENFLTGINKNRHIIYLIDYGLAKQYAQYSSEHRRDVNKKDCGKVIGTARYCSINSHCSCELSRRDDIEALAYMLIYFMRGGYLPWQNLRSDEPVVSRAKRYQMIHDKKVSTKLDELCYGFPGNNEMAHFIRYTRSLPFSEGPNYKYLKSLLLKIYKDNNLGQIDWDFDWSK